MPLEGLKSGKRKTKQEGRDKKEREEDRRENYLLDKKRELVWKGNRHCHNGAGGPGEKEANLQ